MTGEKKGLVVHPVRALQLLPACARINGTRSQRSKEASLKAL
jgi:hypothetical protein